MLPSSRLIDISKDDEEKYGIDSNLYSSRGKFGVSRINEFNKYIEGGKGGSIEGSNYFVYPGQYGRSDLETLQKNNARIILSPIEKGSSSNSKAVKQYGDTFRLAQDKNMFLHSKYYVVESQSGNKTARIDTAGIGNSGALGFNKGPMGYGQTNLFYQTSNSQIVNEVERVHAAISDGGVASSGQFIKVNEDIISSLNKDIQKARGDISIHSAGIGLGAPQFEKSPVERQNINRFYDLISNRSASGKNRVFFSVSNPNLYKNKSILGRLAANDVMIGQRKKIAGTNIPNFFGMSKGTSEHYNLFVLEDVGDEGDVVYLTTRRLTGSDTDEIALRLTSSFDAEAVNFFKSFNFSRFDFDIDSYVSNKKRTSRGYNNSQLTPFFNSNLPQYIIPSRHGVSHFYEMALYNASRRTAGKKALDIIEQRGYATAAYVIKQASKYEGSMAATIPRFIVDYDREMNTPGLGYYVNQWGIQSGFGRIYKDEYGALPSFAGAIGAVIDRSLGYYIGEMHVNDFFNSREDLNLSSDYSTMSAGAGKGMFESTLTFATNFVLTSATAVLSYFTFGMPAQYASAEAFKFSLQSMIDIALDQSDNVSKMTFMKNAYIANVLGVEFLQEEYAAEPGTSRGRKIRKRLGELAKGKDNSIKDFYSTRLHTIPGYNNALYRRRAGYIFDTVVDPFIEEIVSPYQANINNKKWVDLRQSISNYSKALYDPIYLKYEKNPDTKGKWVLKNIGYERAENIAKALDEVLIHLPANPLKWGFFGKTNNTTQDFTTLGEIFSFTDLVSTFERMYFNTGFQSIVGRAEIIDNGGGLKTGFAKLQSIANIPGQIIKAGWNRFKYSKLTLQGPIQEHRKLRKIQSEMIQKGMLTWDGDLMTRKINLTSEADFHKFLDSVMEYQAEIAPNLKMSVSPQEAKILGDRENKMTAKATAYFKEQQTKVAQIRKINGKIKPDPILNNKGKIGIAVFGALAAGLALDDLFNSYGGASIWNQIAVSLNHKDATAVEFSANRFLPSHGVGSTVLSLGYTGFAFAAGYSMASYMQGVEFERYQFSAADNTYKTWLTNWAHSKNQYTKTGELLSDFMEEKLTKGIMTPKGNFLRNFLMSSVAILAARDLARNVAVGTLNLIRGIPVIGEHLLGKGKITPSANLILASRLGSFREAVLTKMDKSMPVSDLERISAYRAGVMLKHLSIVKNNKSGSYTQVLAQQAPLPVFQFFLTQTTKGKRESPSGKVLAKGKTFWSFGMQTAPILGGNAVFSSPIALDYDGEKKNALGFSIVYNDDKTNVLNYFNSVAAFGAGAMMTAGLMLGVLDGMGSIAKLFNKDAQLTADLLQAGNTVRTIAKTFDKGLEALTLVPHYGLNFRGIKEADKEFYDTLLKEFGTKTPGKLPKKLPMGLRAFRGISAAIFYGVATRFVTDIFTDDENVINIGTTVGALSFGAMAFNEHHIYHRVAPMTRQISKVWNAMDVNILSKASRSKFFFPVVFAGLAYLGTDSNFGISKGMDTDYNGEADWVKRMTTMGVFAGLGTVSHIAFNDIGTDAIETYKAYSKFRKHSAKFKSNPITYAYSLYAGWRKHDLAKDATNYKDMMQKYLQQFDVSQAAKNLAGSQVTETQMNNAIHAITRSNKFQLDEILNDDTLRESYEKVFQADEFKKFTKSKAGRNVMGSRRGFRVLKGIAGVSILTTVVASAIGGVMRETTDTQEAMDTFYDAIDNFGTGGINSVAEGVGNAIRLITGRDKKVAYSPLDGDITQRIVTDSSGRYVPLRGKRLLKFTDARANNISKIVQNLISPYVIDPQEPYQAILPFVGVTFRRGDKGLRLNFYSQFQSANQDVSSAIYHMSQSYMFNMAMQSGSSQLRMIVEKSMQRIGKDILYTENSGSTKLRKVAIAIYSATAQMDALSPRNRRKFTMLASDGVQNAISGDSLLSMSIRERTRRISELANQPLESVLSRMTDFNDPSQLMSTGSTIDMENYFGAAEASMSPEDRKLLMGGDKYDSVAKQFFFHVMNPLGKLAFKTFDFSWDKKKKAVQSNQLAIDSASEFMEYESIFLDVNSFEKSNINPLSILKPVNNILNFVTLGFKPFKWGVYFAAGSFVGFATLGALGGVFMKVEKPAILDAVNITQNMFGEFSSEDTLKGFTVERRLTSGNGVAMDTNAYQIRRGNILYEVRVPDGVNPNDFRQSYTNILSDVQVKVQKNTDKLVGDVFGILDSNPHLSNWQGKQRIDFIQDLKSTYKPLLDRYVDELFSEEILNKKLSGMPDGFEDLTFGGVSSSRFSSDDSINEMKAAFKNQMESYLDEVLEQEISGRGIFGDDVIGDNLLSRYRNIGSQSESVKYLGLNVLDRMKFMFMGLRQNLLILETQDYSGYTMRMEKQIDKWVKEADSRTISSFFQRRKSRTPILKNNISPLTGGSIPDSMLEGINNRTAYSRLTTLGKVGGFAVNLTGVFEVFDIYGSYTRLAQAQDSDNFTTADETYLAQHAGAVTINSGIGITSAVILGKVLKVLPKLAAGASKSKSKAGLIIGGIALTGLTVAAFWKNIKEVWHKFNHSYPMQKTYEMIGNAYEGVAKLVGSGVLGLGKFIENTTGIKRSAVTGAVGGILGGLTAALAAAAFVPAMATAGTLGLFAVGGGIIGGALSMIPGYNNLMGNLSGQVTRNLSKIPFIGAMLATPLEELFGWRSNRFYDPNSPIVATTTQKAIEQDYKNYLLTAKDYTGNRTKSLLTNATIYGQRSRYRSSEPSNRALSLRPTNLVNPLIDRELSVRAQHYGQSVLGRTMWYKQISNAENSNELKEYMKVLESAEPQVKQQLDRAKSTEKAEVEKLKADIIKFNKGQPLNTNQEHTAVAKVLEYTSSVVNKKQERIRTQILVDNKQNFNLALKDIVDYNQYQSNSLVVASKNIQAVKDDRGDVSIKESIGESNDIQLSIVGDFITPLSINHPEFSG